MSWRWHSLLGALLLGGLSACSAVAPTAPALQQGFRPTWIDSSPFRLLALTRQHGPSTTLTVYIEGDGAAWRSPYHPPRDPTPPRPLALALAMADNAPLVVYLGRPCQYLTEAELATCNNAYWLARRFAPEVIAAYDGAITSLRTQFGANHVRLIGYSGGGVIAALLAAQRDDVERLITIAAPLALTAWTTQQGYSALDGSLDPATATPRHTLRSALHFAGSADDIVPPAIVRRFVDRAGGRLEIVAGFDHSCCWQREWPRLLSLAQEEMPR